MRWCVSKQSLVTEMIFLHSYISIYANVEDDTSIGQPEGLCIPICSYVLWILYSGAKPHLEPNWAWFRGWGRVSIIGLPWRATRNHWLLSLVNIICCLIFVSLKWIWEFSRLQLVRWNVASLKQGWRSMLSSRGSFVSLYSSYSKIYSLNKNRAAPFLQ